MVVEMKGVIAGDARSVWQAWKPSFAMRPRHEESRNRDLYPLAFGLRIPVSLVAVNEMRNWTVEHSLPAGRLIINHWMSSRGDGGGVEVGKTFEVHGPMAMVYRLVVLPKVRRDWVRQLTELERRARDSAAEDAGPT